jgi:hypothetical protein
MSGASIISLSPSHISFATAASLLPSLRMDFNLRTPKKTQNIHNNNKKKKGHNFWRESHSRLVQIPLFRTHSLSKNTYTPSLPIARTRKSLPKKVTVPKHHKFFKSTKLSKM